MKMFIVEKSKKKIKITYNSTIQETITADVYRIIFHNFLYINTHIQSLSTHPLELSRPSHTPTFPPLSQYQNNEI